MSDIPFVAVGRTVTSTSEPTCGLRFVQRSRFGINMKLQQAWAVTYYENGWPVRQQTEWRDVPTTAEEVGGLHADAAPPPPPPDLDEVKGG